MSALTNFKLTGPEQDAQESGGDFVKKTEEATQTDVGKQPTNNTGKGVPCCQEETNEGAYL